MSNCLLLDCTLRDGGYINNWHFGRNVISAVSRNLSAAKIDIIEVGFLTDKQHSDGDSLYFDCSELDEVLTESGKGISQIAAMIAIGEMEMDPERLLPADQSRLDIVRITFHNTDDEIRKMVRYTEELMKKGYKVCVQPVGTTSYTDKELLELITLVNSLSPYAFYLVDTLGLLQRKELMHFVDLIDHNLGKDIRLGFHSHNNLQMSYANAQSILEYSSHRVFILDCSVYGMGRGSGNLCTELITQYIDREETDRYDLIPIYDLINDHIYPIYVSSGWGYNAHHYISAVHECHPNYASFLLNKQTLTMNEINLILKNIPNECRAVFNKRLIERLYYDFQNHTIDDAADRAELMERINGRDILLLALGKTIISHKDKIDRFIDEKHPLIIMVNSTIRDYPCDYIFVSNLKRLFMLDTEKLSIPAILTSNLPHIVKNAVYVDYAELCVEGDEADNAGMMLLRLVRDLGAYKVYIAGFDGFGTEPTQNYCDRRLINSVEPEAMEKKNADIGEQIRQIRCDMEIVPLTPSRYFLSGEKGRDRLIIFDLDGTLADTSAGIIECHKYANAAMGREVHGEDLNDVIGAPLLKTYIDRFGYEESAARDAIKIFRAHYEESAYQKSMLYGGMKECLENLRERGFMLSVATMKEEKLAKRVLHALGIDQYFDMIHGVDDHDSLTKTDLLRICIGESGVDISNTVLVGDSTFDFIAAKQAGVDFLGVTYGFGFTKETKAEFPLANSCKEINDYIIRRNTLMNTRNIKNPAGGGYFANVTKCAAAGKAVAA